MKIYARTLDDNGMRYLPVELPPRTYEIVLVSGEDEPEGRFAFIVADREGGGIVLRARDAQLLFASKASNSVEVAAVDYRLGVPHGRSAPPRTAIPQDRCRVDGAIVTFEQAHRLLNAGASDVECSHAVCPRECPNRRDPREGPRNRRFSGCS